MKYFMGIFYFAVLNSKSHFGVHNNKVMWTLWTLSTKCRFSIDCRRQEYAKRHAKLQAPVLVQPTLSPAFNPNGAKNNLKLNLFSKRKGKHKVELMFNRSRRKSKNSDLGNHVDKTGSSGEL